MKWLFTYDIKIWLGLREQYTTIEHSVTQVYTACQKHCDNVGDCVTVTPTRYIYKNGFEDGVVIQWIRYPRFPMNPLKMQKKALKLANDLMIEFGQFKVCVVTPLKTYMLENENVKVLKP